MKNSLKVSLHLILILIISFGFSMFHFNSYMQGSIPTFKQGILSILYVCLWFGYSILMGLKSESWFIKFTAWFIGILTLILILGSLFHFMILPGLLVVFSYVGALYGLEYFVGVGDSLYQALFQIMTNYLIIISGYVIGHKIGISKVAKVKKV